LGPVCEEDAADAIRTAINWKVPGRDRIANFWLKKLTETQSIDPLYLTN
jgi:hypothetical protein